METSFPIALIQQILNGILTGSSYILIALGLTLIFGVYRVINMAHGVFFMWGAYFGYLFSTVGGLNPYLATCLSMGLTGLLGIVVERTIFRPLQGSAEWVLLVVGIGVYFTLENFGWIVQGPLPLHIHAYPTQVVLRFFGLYVNCQNLIIAGTCILLLGLFAFVLRKTDIGRAMRAVSVNREAARLVGVNPDRISMLVFFLSGAFAACAGCLVGSLTSVNPAMGFRPQLIAFIIVVFGGMGSIIGSVVGAIVVGVMQNLIAWAVTPKFSYTITMLMLLLLFIVRPTGLFGEKS